MARLGSGEVAIRRRSLYTNPAGPMAARAPRLYSPYRGAPNADPTFRTRLAGQYDRQQLADAASQAGNSMRNGRAASPNPQPWFQNVRESAIRGAAAQDVMHWQIRRDMANDAQGAWQSQMDNIREWARMAIEGDWRNAELMQRQDEFEAQNQLAQQELEQRGTQFDTETQLKRDDMNQTSIEAARERGDRAQLQVDELASRERMQKDELASREAIADKQATAMRRRANNQAQQARRKERGQNPGQYSAGYEGMQGSDTAKWGANPKAREDFGEAAAALAMSPEGASMTKDQVIRQTAKDLGYVVPPEPAASTDNGQTGAIRTRNGKGKGRARDAAAPAEGQAFDPMTQQPFTPSGPPAQKNLDQAYQAGLDQAKLEGLRGPAASSRATEIAQKILAEQAAAAPPPASAPPAEQTPAPTVGRVTPQNGTSGVIPRSAPDTDEPPSAQHGRAIDNDRRNARANDVPNRRANPNPGWPPPRPADLPPDAMLGTDGKYYVIRNGKKYVLDQA